ncbi:hypothetical protein RRG08_061355 [Elysia crispata]|uniref:Uncharacterized protein n=1 Tax=Elysia crispata TaxID=231223 RepID=A0AAE1AFE5_9GAST|nr:hypothetical protein RRG08_061355 [Elysia crispata]
MENSNNPDCVLTQCLQSGEQIDNMRQNLDLLDKSSRLLTPQEEPLIGSAKELTVWPPLIRQASSLSMSFRSSTRVALAVCGDSRLFGTRRFVCYKNLGVNIGSGVQSHQHQSSAVEMRLSDDGQNLDEERATQPVQVRSDQRRYITDSHSGVMVQAAHRARTGMNDQIQPIHHDLLKSKRQGDFNVSHGTTADDFRKRLRHHSKV